MFTRVQMFHMCGKSISNLTVHFQTAPAVPCSVNKSSAPDIIPHYSFSDHEYDKVDLKDELMCCAENDEENNSKVISGLFTY